MATSSRLFLELREEDYNKTISPSLPNEVRLDENNYPTPQSKIKPSKYISIYVNFDGYPSYMLEVLNCGKFNKYENILKMMAFGDLSYITKTSILPYQAWRNEKTSPSLSDNTKFSENFAYIFDSNSNQWKQL